MLANQAFLSPERDARLAVYECANRPAVGFSADYPAGLVSGMHSHRRAQLIYAISGVMRVETDKALFVLPPSKALLLSADTAHSITMEGYVAMRQLFLNPETASSMASAPRVMSVTPLLRELLVALCGEPPDWKLDGRGSHLVALIIGEIACARTLPTKLPLPKDPRVKNLVRAILDYPGDRRGLDIWADNLGASARTIDRVFLRETGLSFGQWRLQARLNAAFVLLMTDGNITRIAAEVGFANPSAFGVAFRRTFDLTPGQARDLQRQQPED
ncbi:MULTISPECIES: helix-turn-helix transcriptional regulator [Rhizobium/Agrobacterium group]|uniref:AraC family transcriptional regulator n=1 Tax=Rhizobium rhizogenes TaxID=359 RepID=A0A546X3K2_RHIRH|nr:MULTISPECIES: helix-turn-helix transcriptional regulator [Rhizobium/Agrobacterium group]TRA95254.1 AraC family transcriptional regulator [Rhizobium rhizogenes]